jgi:hypothetical protein
MTVRAKEDVDPQHESYVEIALDEAGYTFV